MSAASLRSASGCSSGAARERWSAGELRRHARLRTRAGSYGAGRRFGRVLAIRRAPSRPRAWCRVTRRFNVGGIFASGMYEIDDYAGARDLDDAARLLRLGNNVTRPAAQARRPVQRAADGARRLERDRRRSLHRRLDARTCNFFRSIELTKRMLFFILLLVVAVAAFNIVSTLVMAVKDKRPDIAILRTLGARPRSILANLRHAGHRHRFCRARSRACARRAARGQLGVARARARSAARTCISWMRACTS